MPCAPPARKIELRFAATGLANKDFLSLSDPFLVCHTVRNGLPSTEIGRTETVQDDLNPVWATTISFDYSPADAQSYALLIDIFDRDSVTSESLSKHDFLGRAVFRIPKLLDSPHSRLDLPLLPARKLLIPPPTCTFSSFTDTAEDDDNDNDTLDSDNLSPPPSSNFRKNLFSHSPRDTESSSVTTSRSLRRTSFSSRHSAPRPSAATMDLMRATTSSRASKKVRGTLSIFAETLVPDPGLTVVFRIRSALLRDHCTLGTPLGRRITQFYEIQRERVEGSHTSWSCVFRSNDGIDVDRNNYIVFEDVNLDERTFNNMQRERKIRVAFYRRHVRSQHELISYVSTSLAELLTPRFRASDVALKMEGEFGDDDGLGNVLVRRVDRWVAEGKGASVERAPAREDVRINLRADHFLHRKYVSSLNDAPGHVRRLRQLPSFISMH